MTDPVAPLKLDERTEQLLLWLANGSKRVGTPDVVDALRRCIRELEEQAYSKGSWDALQRLAGKVPA